MTEELKPCPFCGRRDVAQGSSRGFISVWCFCGAEGPRVAFPDDCIDPRTPILECYEAWNRRPGNPTPSSILGVKPLEWNGNEARSPVGQYRVQRLDDKWEPLHDGYYMLPRLYGMVKAFDTVEQAKGHAEDDYRKRVLSALSTAKEASDV